MTSPLIDWRDAFRRSDTLSATATPAEKARRGRDFEKILSAMFGEAGLQPRLRYRPTGEEIDGSIWLDGRTVLIEAKWTRDPHPASSLYQFKGKVDGKLVGTVGVFFSIGGFSSDAVDALVAGKELNVVLVDGDDIRAIVDGRLSITEALHRKLRAAGDTGAAFLPLTASLATAPPSGHSFVFVEGVSDARYLEAVRRAFGVTSSITIVPTAGAMNMPRLIRSMLDVSDRVSAITAIVDGDLDEKFVERLRQELKILASVRVARQEAVVVDPDLETVLGLTDPELSFERRTHLRGISDVALDELVSPEALLDRAADSPSLASVLRVIGVQTLRS